MGLPTLAAKKKTVKTEVRSWQLPSSSGHADTVIVDTTLINMSLRNPIYDYSINCAYNANVISPVESRIYFDRRHYADDPFADAYAPYLITSQNVRFYRTNIPYSRVGYSRGFTSEHEEHAIDFLFTGNITRAWNMGLQLDYLKSPGHFANQEGRVLRGSLFTSYNSDHYNIQAALSWTNIDNFDNGGMSDPEDIKGHLKPGDYPVKMQAMAGYKYIGGYLNHYYSITTPRHINDTTVVQIPTLTFRHIFDTDQSARRYVLHDPVVSQDRTQILTVRNTLSVTFEEAFTGKANIGAAAYVRHEAQRFYDSTYIAQPDSLTKTRQTWDNNLFVGGTVYRRNGRFFRFDAEGEICVVGYKIGQFQARGGVEAIIPIRSDSMTISAHAYIENKTPNHYYQHFRSVKHTWDNSLARVYKYGIEGEWSYPTQYVQPRIKVRFEDLQHQIYFDPSGTIAQNNGHVQILAADVQLNIRTPWINLDNSVVVQRSSSSTLPLPLLSLYHNLYYHGWWAKHAMEAQIGVDCRYFTAYNAPILDLSTGQFHIQDSEKAVKVGNYPVLDVYANFYVKLIHLKFFVAYTHVNHLFMRKNMNQFLMPDYPMNPDVIRAGLAFHFYK